MECNFQTKSRVADYSTDHRLNDLHFAWMFLLLVGWSEGL